ncbi:hypothetical protein [Enterococcus faecium]|uniref:hypothetical protein n=1 Tax=Enterococcus faecium TaxID=1352 RepID=UPI001CC74697|nr:hypothetical protein [Enterococcus faecium]
METKDVEPNGHDWNEKYTVDKQPTTTEDGSKSIHCKSCNVVKDSTVIPAIGQQPAEVNPEGALSNRTLVVSEATSTDKQFLTDAVKNQYKDKFSGKELWMLDINLIDTSVWEKVHDETVTFTLGYPAGITDDNYQNYDFVVLHQKADGSMELSNFVATAHGLKITSTLSPLLLATARGIPTAMAIGNLMQMVTGMSVIAEVKQMKGYIPFRGSLTKKQPLPKREASMRNAPFAITRKQL